MRNILRQWRQKWAYAVWGLIVAFREEKSLWAYSIILLACVITGVFAHLSVTQWAILIGAHVVTIVVELINTAIEASVDAISFQYNVKIKKIKDVASAAALVATVGMVIISVLIFVSAFTGLI